MHSPLLLFCSSIIYSKTDCDNPVQLKAKESESDPLISAEKGGGHLVDSAMAKSSPGWNSNKDLQA